MGKSGNNDRLKAYNEMNTYKIDTTNRSIEDIVQEMRAGKDQGGNFHGIKGRWKEQAKGGGINEFNVR